MPLKVCNISHDSIAKVAIISFGDVLDEMPKLSATINLSTIENQTQAEINALITSRVCDVLSEALRLCSHRWLWAPKGCAYSAGTGPWLVALGCLRR